MNNQQTTDRMPAANSTFAIGGVSCSADSFVVKENSVLRINICLKSPPIANLQNVSGQLKGQNRNENGNFEMKIFVETERLILREILPTDIEGMFVLDSDPEVHRYLGNKPVINREQIIDVINFVRRQYIDHGIGRWAIIDKRTKDFMGWTGLKFVTDLTNRHQNYYDLGYRLIRKFWGQGIATETAIASLDYAFNKLNIEEIYAAASCENAASNKILQKVGLNFIESFYYADIKCNWYKIDKNDYDNKKPNR